MKRRYSVGASITALFLVSSVARAQCPLGMTNPLNILNNTSWAFLTTDGVMDSTVGVFTATIGLAPRGTVPTGLLKITESFNNVGDIEEAVQTEGAYSIYPDCSGGQIDINGAANAFQFQFFFANNFTKMYLVTSNASTPNNGLGTILAERGTAVLLPAAPSCSGVPNPLSLLVGNWTLGATGLFGPSFSKVEIEGVGATIALMNAQLGPVPNNPHPGVLNVMETSSSNVSLQVLAKVQGSYDVYPDCSGGRLFFGSGIGNGYSFYFAGPNQLFMVANRGDGAPLLPSTRNSVPLTTYGVAERH